MDEYIKPAIITFGKEGKEYTLDFNRDAVRFAEARGFQVEDVAKFPATKVPELFFYAFRKNHKNLAKSHTDNLLEEMGGLSGALLERLVQLYQQAALVHVISIDEDAGKNPNVTVTL